eukprot:scaffold2720_cov212-Pinguiococcus_pyrenoidosus.AAC.4
MREHVQGGGTEARFLGPGCRVHHDVQVPKEVDLVAIEGSATDHAGLGLHDVRGLRKTDLAAREEITSNTARFDLHAVPALRSAGAVATEGAATKLLHVPQRNLFTEAVLRERMLCRFVRHLAHHVRKADLVQGNANCALALDVGCKALQTLRQLLGRLVAHQILLGLLGSLSWTAFGNVEMTPSTARASRRSRGRASVVKRLPSNEEVFRRSSSEVSARCRSLALGAR